MVEFDVIPYEDIVWGRKLGSGSFGSVYKGTYLDIDIAIKEILASTEYDVHKYFEREWRIMRECRHPNIVLFLGLSQVAEGDGKVYIVSEYVPCGNLRQYILSSRPFPWRLRLSFATDVARAVAYLHARKCIHRDLKGENLLLTSNERVKVTDFGFARIASRSAEEMKRMTYCGTDGYMSPEIINGQDFDLPTDVFSLGIIFLEILSHKLVDQHTFIRVAPSFTPSPDEIRRRASQGCPKTFIDLALDCCKELPSTRPVMTEVLGRLREVELEILGRSDDPTGAEHVGSVKLLRHTGPRAMPIFTPLTPVLPTTDVTGGSETVTEADSEHEEEEAKIEQEALKTLAGLNVEGRGATGAPSTYGSCRTARWDESTSEIDNQTTDDSVREAKLESAMMSPVQLAHLPTATVEVSGIATEPAPADSTADIDVEGASAMTIRVKMKPSHTVKEDDAIPSTANAAFPEPPGSWPGTIGTIPSLTSQMEKLLTKHQRGEKEDRVDLERIGKIAAATHRFTLVDKDAVPLVNGKKISSFSAFGFLQKGLNASTKCPVCQKRLGQRPALRCDDCEILVHVKCSHAAQRNCTG